MKIASSLIAVSLLLAGCSGTRYCEREQPHDDVAVSPPIQPVDGIAPPQSPSALVIPEVAEGGAAFAEVTTDPQNPERTRVRCLDMPPGLPALPEDNGDA
jgi:PBP1b-binding outer membrane lipoprotein LpoB